MLKISLDTDINNIAYLDYMSKQEEKVNVNHNAIWGESSPPQADIEERKKKNPENIPGVLCFYWASIMFLLGRFIKKY